MSERKPWPSSILDSLTLFGQTFVDTLLRQLDNQTIAGGLALGGASIFAQLGWKVLRLVRSTLFRAIFTVYVIPKSSVQYRYLLEWLRSQPNAKSNVIEVTAGRKAGLYSRASGSADDEQAEGYDIAMYPSLGSMFWMFHRGKFLWISTGKGSIQSKPVLKPAFPPTRTPQYNHDLSLSTPNSPSSVSDFPSITTIGAQDDVIKAIIREGRQMLKDKAKKQTTIYASDSTAWNRLASRPARKLQSIVLPENQAEDIAADCQEFLQSEEWYFDRGIPYRRGYLLYGLPGCGKVLFYLFVALSF